MDDILDTYKRQFNWSLTKEQVERYLGRPLVDHKEFIRFCKHFESNFILQFPDTLEWQAREWDDEVKHWDDPETMDISHLMWK